MAHMAHMAHMALSASLHPGTVLRGFNHSELRQQSGFGRANGTTEPLGSLVLLYKESLRLTTKLHGC